MLLSSRQQSFRPFARDPIILGVDQEQAYCMIIHKCKEGHRSMDVQTCDMANC